MSSCTCEYCTGGFPTISVDGVVVDVAAPKNLERWRKSALSFTNTIRKRLGLEPIEELVRGAIGVPEACVLNQAISAEGLFAKVDYESIVIYDYVPKWNEDYDEFVYEKLPIKKYKVPNNVKRFLRAFDDGLYPDLAVPQAEIYDNFERVEYPEPEF